MTISLSVYDTATLVATVPSLFQPSMFMLDSFFTRISESPQREIAIDVDNGKRRMAPFVSPLVAGKPVESRGITTNLFAPAYIKDKRVLDPFRPVMRSYGERIGGGATPVEREMQNIAFEMEDQIAMINRRLEWMANQALLTGTVTIAGEGFPTQLVNFGRDPDLTVTLDAPAQWTAANIGTPIAPGTVSPSANIQDWATLVLQKSGGVVTDLVFTSRSWHGFILDPKVRDSIFLPRAGDSTIELGGRIRTGGMAKGTWGLFNLWHYADWYVDPVTETLQPMLPDGTLLLISQQMQGIRAFGTIIDPEFAYGALAYAPKSWVEKDPAVRMLMMQSAPMVIPARINAAMAVTVC